MSLQKWAANGWLRAHVSSKEEVRDLLNIVERDLTDASTVGLSADWKFGIAYNAVLKLCTVLLYARGYRPEKQMAHYRTLQALPLILGDQHRSDADYLDVCRKKRNETEYDFADGVSEDEADELMRFCHELKSDVRAWLYATYPHYL